MMPVRLFMSRMYTNEEKAQMFDEATAAGLLWPSSIISRSSGSNR